MQVNVGGGVQNMLGGARMKLGGGGAHPPRKSASAEMLKLISVPWIMINLLPDTSSCTCGRLPKPSHIFFLFAG